MGSKSKSKTSSNSTTIDLTSAVNDNRIGGEGAVIDGNITISAGQSIDGLSIEKTDFGAIRAANDLVSQAGSFFDEQNSRVVALASQVAKDSDTRAFETVAAVERIAKTADPNDSLAKLAIGALVVAGVSVASKRFG